MSYRIAETGSDYTVNPPQMPLGTSHAVLLEDLWDDTVYDIIIHMNTQTHEFQVRTEQSPGTNVTVVWAGGASPDLRWTRGMNWQGGVIPSNPHTTFSGGIGDALSGVAFFEAGAGTPHDDWKNDPVTMILNPQDLPEGTDTWTVRNFNVGSATGHDQSHRIDLGGNRLRIRSGTAASYLQAGHRGWRDSTIHRGIQRLIIENGTVEVGPQTRILAGNSAERGRAAYGTLILPSGTVIAGSVEVGAMKDYEPDGEGNPTPAPAQMDWDGFGLLELNDTMLSVSTSLTSQ